jgi:hypothetical protein
LVYSPSKADFIYFYIKRHAFLSAQAFVVHDAKFMEIDIDSLFLALFVAEIEVEINNVGRGILHVKQ